MSKTSQRRMTMFNSGYKDFKASHGFKWKHHPFLSDYKAGFSKARKQWVDGLISKDIISSADTPIEKGFQKFLSKTLYPLPDYVLQQKYEQYLRTKPIGVPEGFDFDIEGGLLPDQFSIRPTESETIKK